MGELSKVLWDRFSGEALGVRPDHEFSIRVVRDAVVGTDLEKGEPLSFWQVLQKCLVQWCFVPEAIEAIQRVE